MISKRIGAYNNKTAKISKIIFLCLLAYMPFHVFLSNWIGTKLGVLEFAKAIKEPIMLVGFLMIIFAQKNNLKTIFKKDKRLYVAIIAYGLVICLSAVVFNNNQFAEIVGIAYDYRFLCFFIYGILLANYFKQEIRNLAIKIVLITGVSVALLGILQVVALPNNTLSQFGYSKSTGSQQVFYIHDDTQTTERAFSSLKDPNALGSYLGIVLALLVAFLVSQKKKFKKAGSVLIFIILLCIYLTYSRSAWIGLFVAAILLTIFLINNHKGAKKFIYKNYKALIVALATFIAVLTSILFANPNLYKGVMLHNEFNNNVNSNSKRLDQYEEALSVIKNNFIFGVGAGAAGPVSFKNLPHPPIISENYYFQIFEEFGVVGFVLFMYILAYVAKKLYKQAKRGDIYSLAILAALITVSVANLFNHNWTNEAIAYTWWGLAGLVIGGGAIRTKKYHV